MSEAVVVARGIRKSFTAGQEVLRGVDLDLPAGARVAIVGPSGCGKSTLLNLIGGLDRPDAGSLRVAGTDYAGADESVLTKLRNTAIGFVFQDHHLLPQCTVLENVLLPCLAASGKASAEQIARGRQLLQQVGIGHRADNWPSELSGGQRQRVAVARSLIMQPRLLLADEPTGALDEKTATEVGELLDQVQRDTGVALLVVTHSKELAARMDSVRRMAQGVLEAA